MILLGRLCRCHYASNPAVSAAVRVACLSAFQASPGPCRPSLGPRLLAPLFWSPELESSPSLCSLWPLSLSCPLAACRTLLSAHTVLPHALNRSSFWWRYPPAWCYHLVHHSRCWSFSFSHIYSLAFCSSSYCDAPFPFPAPHSNFRKAVCMSAKRSFAVFEVTGESVTLSPFGFLFIRRAAPSHCLHALCYLCQGMSLCLMTEPLSGWKRLSG